MSNNYPEEPIVIPPSLSNRQGDYVWYNYTHKDETIVIDNAVCYAKCMTFISECDILLRPSSNKSILPFNTFQKYIKLCQENGLVNKDVTITGEEGNNQLIVPKGHGRHRTYATLCCYRWSENQPGMAYATVAAMETIPEIDFFQAFHYGCARRIYWDVHSFHSIISSNSTYNRFLAEKSSTYVPYSLILAWCFRHKDNDGKTWVEKWYGDDYTVSHVSKTICKLGFPLVGNDEAKKYRIKKLEQILSPKLKSLYEKPIPLEIIEKTVMEI